MEDKLEVRPDGKIFWDLKRTPELQIMHEKLYDVLRPLTEGMIMDQFRNRLDNPNLDSKERERIMKYGVSLAGKQFLPHITLGKLKNPADAKVIVDIKPRYLNIDLEKIVVGQLEYEGQMTWADLIESS